VFWWLGARAASAGNPLAWGMISANASLASHGQLESLGMAGFMAKMKEQGANVCQEDNGGGDVGSGERSWWGGQVELKTSSAKCEQNLSNRCSCLMGEWRPRRLSMVRTSWCEMCRVPKDT